MASLAVVAVGAVSAVGYWYANFYLDLPDGRGLAAASSGHRLCSPENGSAYTQMAVIPVHVRDAIIAAEDPDYFINNPEGNFLKVGKLIFAALAPESAVKLHASSISDFVARCLIFSSIERENMRASDWHIAHFIVVGRIERMASKEEAFVVFANEVSFGHGTHGVAETSQRVFGKSLSSLTLSEAALLAGLIRNAGGLLNRPVEAILSRRNTVLDKMARAGFVSPQDAELAKSKPAQLTLTP